MPTESQVDAGSHLEGLMNANKDKPIIKVEKIAKHFSRERGSNLNPRKDKPNI